MKVGLLVGLAADIEMLSSCIMRTGNPAVRRGLFLRAEGELEIGWIWHLAEWQP